MLYSKPSLFSPFFPVLFRIQEILTNNPALFISAALIGIQGDHTNLLSEVFFTSFSYFHLPKTQMICEASISFHPVIQGYLCGSNSTSFCKIH